MQTWGGAALFGVVLAILLMIFGVGFLRSLFVGVLAFVVLGAILSAIRCEDEAEKTDLDEFTDANASKPSADVGGGSTKAAATTTAASAAASAPQESSDDVDSVDEDTDLAEDTDPVEDNDPVEDAGAEETITAEAEVEPEPEPEHEPEPEPEHEAEAEPESQPEPEPKADPDPQPEPPAAVASEPEPEAEPGAGTRPEALDAARDGQPDDLKKIKGVGPKLEKLLHSLGFYHFDQLAAWTQDEVAWVDQNLEGFKGRVTRDQWVAQAKALAEEA